MQANMFKDDLDEHDALTLLGISRRFKELAEETESLSRMVERDEYRAIFGHRVYLMLQAEMNCLEGMIFNGGHRPRRDPNASLS